MSTGTGGSGYRVEVDNLRAFAAQVRGLLSEFQTQADGTRVHGQSGVASGAFGSFEEAADLHDRYLEMRDTLRRVLNGIYDTIDEVQQKADRTAVNYEEQEYETSRAMKLSDDGWSTAPPPVRPASMGRAARPGTVAGQPASGNSAGAEETW